MTKVLLRMASNFKNPKCGSRQKVNNSYFNLMELSSFWSNKLSLIVNNLSQKEISIE